MSRLIACPDCGGVANPHASGLRWMVIIELAILVGILFFGLPIR